MNEIYWLTRLDAIHIIAIIMLVVGTALTIMGGIGVFACKANLIDNKYRKDSAYYKEWTLWQKMWKQINKIFIPILVVGLIVDIFVPTTKSALLIWGVGGTIDYIKQNPTAKQIPDKCIIALDKWVDSLSESKDSTVVK